MSSIGHQMARELTAQFYRWELRGRGWIQWNDAVELEPPFRPFEGHYLPRQMVVDDGRVESVGSRFAKGLGSLFGVAEKPALPAVVEEIDEPSPAEVDEGRELVELQIALPPEYQPHANVFEQFLFSIGYSSDPVAFEVIGTSEELLVQLTASPEDSGVIRQQLKAFFPEAVIVSEERQLLRGIVIDGSESQVVTFGLKREFMVPINNLKALAADPLVGICGVLDRLGKGEAGVFQVLLKPVRHPWAPSMMRAVTWGEGQPFFANDPELVSQTRVKVSRPLFAVVVRLATSAGTTARAQELLRGLSGALRPLSATQGNELVPLEDDSYEPEEQLTDVVLRRSRRPGMILNSDELIALTHLPTAAVRARSLRRVLRRTKEVPAEFADIERGVCLGVNDHEGIESTVWLPDQTRLNHCHVMGGTGSGKSTLLSQIALQDILAGRGVAVIDPHGDLVDLLIPHIPPERMRDVVLFDPTDEEFAIAFNPLAAASERERDLLATDFIAVMKQNTSSWGDQMSSLLGNAVLAFLYSTRGGTLPELRRFLSDPRYRAEFLTSVTNPEVAYFWEHEAQMANKSAIGSILTRLDSLLRYESLLHILGQRKNLLDFADIMDSGKIFLARLAKGLIGEENAHLLGSLLVSRFYQTTIARQSRSREDRRPYFLLMDEAGDLLTSTVSEILKGTRKYGLGLTLAHQSLSQLRHDDEVYGAVTGSCGTKVCFQVGGDDARKMAEEFGGFLAADLMNQPSRFAIARVGPRDQSFNLEVSFIPEAPRPLDESFAEALSATREKYCTVRSTIRAELVELRRMIPPAKGVDPFAKLKARQEKERKEEAPKAPANPQENTPPRTEAHAAKSPLEQTHPEAAEDEPQTGPPQKSEAIKDQIIQMAGPWGFSYETEKPILGGATRVDLALKLGTREIACQISVTTPIAKEVENLKRCLDAGYFEIALLCDATVKRRSIESRFAAAYGANPKVRFLTVRQFILRLEEIWEESRRARPSETLGELSKALRPVSESVALSGDEKDVVVQEQLRAIQERILRAKGKFPSGG